jgi:hypothetical protein
MPPIMRMPAITPPAVAPALLLPPELPESLLAGDGAGARGVAVTGGRAAGCNTTVALKLAPAEADDAACCSAPSARGSEAVLLLPIATASLLAKVVAAPGKGSTMDTLTTTSRGACVGIGDGLLCGEIIAWGLGLA